MLEIGKNKISNSNKTYIIAEIGSNHDGNLEKAKELIFLAAESGCQAAKIQIPIADECYPPKTKFGGIYGDVEISEVIKSNEIPKDWIEKLVHFGKEIGISIGASADGFIGFDLMLNGGIDFVKVPSFTISHIPLLKVIKKSKLPVLISSGAHNISSLEEAVNVLENPGIFHCISSYPAPLNSLNLNNISFLKSAFDLPIGFSDHSLNPTLGPSAAVALGAKIIEKHFTLKRESKGTDHFFSIEPKELKSLVDSVRKVELEPEFAREILDKASSKGILGNVRRGIYEAEKPFQKKTKLGIYFLKSFKANHVIKDTDIRVFRCANTTPEIHPRFFDLIVGAKIINDVDPFEPVKWTHIISKA